jgi:hypothetical protein
VGDATVDPKGNYAAPGPGVPAYLGWTRYMGETAIDDWFCQIVGDDALADLHLGRLPARDVDEARIMVSKIISYEETPKDQPWHKRLLLVADDEEPVFPQMNDAVAALIPSEYTLVKGYLDQTTPGQLKAQIEAEITHEDAGVLMVNYAGHGSIYGWAHDIFDTDDIRTLSNGQRLPVMVLMTCLNGYFVWPDTRSLAEQMLAADGAGAVAAFASPGMTCPQPQRLLDQGFVQAIFQRGALRLGQAASHAKQTLLANSTEEEDTANSFGLLGDPAMTLGTESPSTASVPVVAGGSGGGGGGCFIASAAYGSFLNRHVTSLRSFRDRWLVRSPVGTWLVRAYYATSPRAARWIRDHTTTRALARMALAPLVAMAKVELDRILVIWLTLVLLASPLVWTHCLTRLRKREGKHGAG